MIATNNWIFHLQHQQLYSLFVFLFFIFNLIVFKIILKNHNLFN